MSDVINSIVILEDDQDLRNLLGEILKSRWAGLVVSVASVDELKNNRLQVLQSRACVLDIDLGPGRATGLDAFDWLSALGYSGKIFFLTGHARNHPLVVKANALGKAKILTKPIGVRDLLIQLGD